MEVELINYAINSGVGVLSFILMYILVNTTLKENTKATNELRDAIILLTAKLERRPN